MLGVFLTQTYLNKWCMGEQTNQANQKHKNNLQKTINSISPPFILKREEKREKNKLKTE